MQNQREIHHYDFIGYDSYFEDVLPKLQDILGRALADGDAHFLIAVNEAVCNAARYSVDGHQAAQIHMDLVVTEEDVTASVACLTQPFDAEGYRQGLRRLAEREDTREMEWCAYTGVSVRSRGFWLMLMAVDYLCVDAGGDKVSLCVARPWDPDVVTRVIGKLAPRFLLERNGVIY